MTNIYQDLPKIIFLQELTLHSGGNASQGAESEVHMFAEAAATPGFMGTVPQSPSVIFGLLL